MKEGIEIENFGCIDYIKLDINKINILIGPQAVGKSLTAKLLYFFKNIFQDIRYIVERECTITDFQHYIEDKFLNYFPRDTWNMGYFKIRYFFGDILIEVNYAQELQINCSKTLKDIFKLYKSLYGKSLKNIGSLDELESGKNSFGELVGIIQKEYGMPIAFKQIFIPAGRSFFASVQSSIFTMLSNNREIDPFLVEFGSYYENTKRLYSTWKQIRYRKSEIIDHLINDILHGSYLRLQGEDYLVHEDDRTIKLNIASSGQQETLPLALILRHISLMSFLNNGATIYIEEPEAHLYPESQKRMVELIAAVGNIARSPLQFVITTHSPYILSSFNNLLEAGNIIKEYPWKSEAVNKIIDERKMLKFDDISAFSLGKDSYKDILDYEMQLISPTILDHVSDDISVEFGKLLDL